MGFDLISGSVLRTSHFMDVLNVIHCSQETSLELASINEDGIVQSIFEQSLFGAIKDLAILPWNNRFQEHAHKVFLLPYSP